MTGLPNCAASFCGSPATPTRLLLDMFNHATVRRLSCASALIGPALILVALCWWWLIFGQVIEYNYMTLPQAVGCIGQSNSICELAMSLCGAQHAFGFARYSPILFWIATALALGGAAMH